MVFGWRRRKSGKKPNTELVIPNHFMCPISLDLMKDPVTFSSGITYDRENIEKWLEAGNFTCPVTNQVLTSFDQIPNHTLRKMIQDWCVQNWKYGVQRIPTPRVPVRSDDVSEIIFSIKDSIQDLDRSGLLHSLNKIKKWGSESEKNRKCILANGTGSVLAEAFEAFAFSSENNLVLEEILSALNWMFPLDDEAKSFLSSQASLSCLVSFLKNNNDVLVKQNAILVLQELSCCDQRCYVEALMADNTGLSEVLVQLIKEPVSRTVTKASLMVIFSLVTSNERMRCEFVEMGLVSLLLNVIIDSERNISEKALGVFDRLCDCKEGREEAYVNALTMPVLVKKILRVSELATEYSVSAIWKLLGKFEKKHEGRVLIECLQVGVFQKLVLVLQWGCDDLTKEKVTELLKLLNPYRSGLECIDSADFKNLKRSF